MVSNFKCIHTYACVICYFFKNNLTNYLYFIIKIVFNFKCIHTYARVTCSLLFLFFSFFFFNNLTNYLYFIIKIVFNFKCFHMFAWLHTSLYIIIGEAERNSILCHVS